jgi:RHS repeat-associated protein
LYSYDANGNVGALLEADGTMVAHYEYDPYGKALVADGPAAKANPYRFSAKYSDDETSLYYYGYRYYQPESGRWVSRDPIGEMGCDNVFVFASNNSINVMDLMGLSPVIDGSPTTIGGIAFDQVDIGAVADWASISWSEWEEMGGFTVGPFQMSAGLSKWRVKERVVNGTGIVFGDKNNPVDEKDLWDYSWTTCCGCMLQKWGTVTDRKYTLKRYDSYVNISGRSQADDNIWAIINIIDTLSSFGSANIGEVLIEVLQSSLELDWGALQGVAFTGGWQDLGSKESIGDWNLVGLDPSGSFIHLKAGTYSQALTLSLQPLSEAACLEKKAIKDASRSAWFSEHAGMYDTLP